MEIGNKIRIKENLVEELLKMGFEKSSAESLKHLQGTEQEILDLCKDDDGNEYATVDLGCEIPVQCCEVI